MLQAYADYNDLMDLTEQLISEMVADLNNGSHIIKYHPNGPGGEEVQIDFSTPWRRISMISGLEEALGVKFPADLTTEETRQFLVNLVGCHRFSWHKIDCKKDTRQLAGPTGHDSWTRPGVLLMTRAI